MLGDITQSASPSPSRRQWLRSVAAGALGACATSPMAAQFATHRSAFAVNPELPPQFTDIAARFQQYDVILQPDQDQPEWWAGGPAVVRDRNGVFWMAARMRNNHPVGPRGYQLRLLRSQDGVQFRQVGELLPAQAGVNGFERPALLLHPQSGKLMLYGCGPLVDGNRWSILRWDEVTDLADIRPSSARPVLVPITPAHVRDFPPSGYKDPVILHAQGRFHLYVIGVLRGVERTYHFSSIDGERWEPVGHPYQAILELEAWHNFAARPASVLPLPFGYLFVYEGSHVSWHDPNYNIATGLGFTFDLHHITDLTPEAPLLTSTTPGELFHTWRYSQWLQVDNEVWAYAEVARRNRTNEIRLFRLRA